MKRERDSLTEKWRDKIAATGVSARSIPRLLEEAGAAGILECYWSRDFGSNKIFGARTTKLPSLDISLEDYSVLYPWAENGHKPRHKIQHTSTNSSTKTDERSEGKGRTRTVKAGGTPVY